MKKILGIVSLALLLVVNASQVNAALVAGWDFDPQVGGTGVWGPSPLAASSVNADVTVGGLTRGSGILTPAGSAAAANAWGGTGWNDSTSAATSIANGDFITFAVTADVGSAVSFTSIDAYNVRRSATGASTGQWQYSVGGGAFTDIGSAITWGAVTTFAGNPQALINLSGIAALQNVTDTVTFRLLNWGGTSAGGTWYLNDPTGTPGNDFIVSGTISAVPEPTSMLLASIAGVSGGYGAWRRRKAKKA